MTPFHAQRCANTKSEDRKEAEAFIVIRLGVDPLGGAGVHYWGPIAERYRLNLTVVNEVVDPTFRFMTVDWDG